MIEHTEGENYADEEAETLFNITAAVIEQIHFITFLIEGFSDVLELARDGVDDIGLRIHLRWRWNRGVTSSVTLKVIKLRNFTLARIETKMREKMKSRRKRKKDFTEGL